MTSPQIAPRATLVRYLIEERRRFPGASGELNGLLLDVSVACKAIARIVALGMSDAANGSRDPATHTDAGDEPQTSLERVTHDLFVRMNEWSGHLAGMASEARAAPQQIPRSYPRGKYLLLFDPLDGSSNIDVNLTVGSIFSILRAPQSVVDAGADVCEADFLQAGTTQVAAGYALYGPATLFVLTVGNGVAGFTLNPDLGEFVLTHDEIRVPPETREFAIDSSNSRFWEAPVKRYVDECLAGRSGPRGKDFNMRWIASMAADAHRILMRGGVFLHPRDTHDPAKTGRLRLLYEANPIAYLMEQAGARASTGYRPLLGVEPDALDQRIDVIFGSSDEVERIERYHREPGAHDTATPLFARRGLFRD